MSAAYEKLPVQEEKVADLPGNLPFCNSKPADAEDGTPEKLPFGAFQNACQRNGFNAPTIESLYHLYWHVDVNQVFGSAYITKTINCSERTGRSLMSKLRQMDVVVPIKGKGKGMYRLKYKKETLP